VSEQVNRKCPLEARNTTLQHSAPTQTLSLPSTSPARSLEILLILLAFLIRWPFCLCC